MHLYCYLYRRRVIRYKSRSAIDERKDIVRQTNTVHKKENDRMEIEDDDPNPSIQPR